MACERCGKPDDDLPFDAGQMAMAEWMGISVEEMNRDHDRLHERMALWLGVPSYSLAVARGKKLTQKEAALASLEENAVLHLQRYLAAVNRWKPS